MESEGLNSWPSSWPDWIHRLKHAILFFSNWNLPLQKEHSRRLYQGSLLNNFNIGYSSISWSFLATSRSPAPKSPILKMQNPDSHLRSNVSESFLTCLHNTCVCPLFLAHFTFCQMDTCTKILNPIVQKNLLLKTVVCLAIPHSHSPETTTINILKILYLPSYFWIIGLGCYFFLKQLHRSIIHIPQNSPSKLYTLKAYNSVIFSILTEFWNHHNYLVLGHFQHPKKKPHAH